MTRRHSDLEGEARRGHGNASASRSSFNMVAANARRGEPASAIAGSTRKSIATAGTQLRHGWRHTYARTASVARYARFSGPRLIDEALRCYARGSPPYERLQSLMRL